MKQQMNELGGEPIPFIAVGGQDNADRTKIAKKLGVAAVIQKPIQAREFCKVIRGTLVAT